MSAGEDALPSPAGVPLSLRGPAPTRVVAGYGFWLFLLSDIIIFAALFAAYAVLSDSTAGGPSGAELFDKTHVFLETDVPAGLERDLWFWLARGAIEDGRSSLYFWMGDHLPFGAVLSEPRSAASSSTCWPSARARLTAPFCRPSLRLSERMACM